MGILDSVTSILGQAIDAAPKILQAINDQRFQELQRDLIKAQIRGVTTPAPTQFQQFAQPIPQPQIPTTSGGGFTLAAPFVQQAALPSVDVPFFDISPQGGAGVFSPFVPTMAGARAQKFIAMNPRSGRITWFGPIGKPILWSGDVSAKKRVERVAKYARRGRR